MSPPINAEPSFIRRIVLPVFCGLVGILIAIAISHIPYSFSSLLLSGFLITFIITHIFWFHKVMQPLQYVLKEPIASERLGPPSSASQPLLEEEHTQDIRIEASFFQKLREKLTVLHQPYLQVQSLQDGKTHLIQTSGLIPLLRDNQLEILVQPIVNLPQKRLSFFSCIPCATMENGMPINLNTPSESPNTLSSNQALDKMVLFQTLQFVRRHHATHPNHGFICTLSPSVYKDRHSLEEITEFLHQTHFPFSGLIFEVPLNMTVPLFNTFSQLKGYGVRFIGKWQNKELPINLAEMAIPSVDFIMLPYGELSAWFKRQPHRQSLASLRHVLEAFPQTIISHVDQEQDLYDRLPLPFDFASGGAFGLPKPFYHIQV
ncbi:MAG: diguanylate phosphodiesterase [Alphaproteobacteria bacterium]|nr:diguanylate phosphodiesterase [Alphaproteobacteria bacterium]